MSDPFQHLIVSERSGLLSVTIDREEKRNALSLEVLGEIRALFESCSEDRTIKAATITGKGGEELRRRRRPQGTGLRSNR